MDSTHIVPFIAFAVGSAPLVWQDVRTLSVSQIGLFAVLAGWMAVAMWQQNGSAAAVLSGGVLTVGAALLLVNPDALGTADVVFLAAMAWLLPFWTFLWAVGAACLLGVAAFVWLSRAGTRDVSGLALPFLPCLALGGLLGFGGMF